MGKAITESSFALAKTLLGTGLDVTSIAKAVGTSTATIYNIKKTNDFGAYKDLRDKQLKVAFDNVKPLERAPEISVAAQTTASSLVDAVNRVAENLEKNTEQLAKLVEAWNNSKSE